MVIFSTWRQMANRRLPREGRKDATKIAHAGPLASARQHLDVETQTGHSSERAVESVGVRNRTGFTARFVPVESAAPNK